MQIQQKDVYHGAALTQIVEHESFKALNKADSKYGHYRVTNNILLLVKYTTKEEQPWFFGINHSDSITISKDIKSKNKPFVCLVCGKTAICVLGKDELEQLLDLPSSSMQVIKVEKTGCLRVSSPKGALQKTVHRNDFPNKIFE